MIDNINPASQFHPYQPMKDIPASERQRSGLGHTLGKVRDYARRRPGVILGSLAALALGAGLMRKRMM